MHKLVLILSCIWLSQEALREYTGTVVAVSHDRYFLRQIVNRVVEVSDRRLQDYVGDYNVSSTLPNLLLLFL